MMKFTLIILVIVFLGGTSLMFGLSLFRWKNDYHRPARRPVGRLHPREHTGVRRQSSQSNARHVRVDFCRARRQEAYLTPSSFSFTLPVMQTLVLAVGLFFLLLIVLRSHHLCFSWLICSVWCVGAQCPSSNRFHEPVDVQSCNGTRWNFSFFSRGLNHRCRCICVNSSEKDWRLGSQKTTQFLTFPYLFFVSFPNINLNKWRHNSIHLKKRKKFNTLKKSSDSIHQNTGVFPHIFGHESWKKWFRSSKKRIQFNKLKTTIQSVKK